jgi:hypothetical protein
MSLFAAISDEMRSVPFFVTAVAVAGDGHPRQPPPRARIRHPLKQLHGTRPFT